MGAVAATQKILGELECFRGADVRAGPYGQMVLTLYKSKTSKVEAHVYSQGTVVVKVTDLRDIWERSLYERRTTLDATGVRTRDPRTWFVSADYLWPRINRSVGSCVKVALEIAVEHDAQWLAFDEQTRANFIRASVALKDGQLIGEALTDLRERLEGESSSAQVPAAGGLPNEHYR